MAALQMLMSSMQGAKNVISITKFGGALSIQNKSLTLSAIDKKRHYGPEPESIKVDEVHHWVNERYVAIALIPLIPGALIYPNVVSDMLLTTAMVLHSHWRLSGVAQDYIHGDILPKIARPTVLLLSIAAFGAITYFNYSDIGFANAARLLYSQL